MTTRKKHGTNGTTAEEITSGIIRSIKPEWIRLPQPGTAEPYTGLKRSKLNELILPSDLNSHKPPVKSICLRNRGQKKGVRLISYDSLMAYLHSLENPEAA